VPTLHKYKFELRPLHQFDLHTVGTREKGDWISGRFDILSLCSSCFELLNRGINISDEKRKLINAPTRFSASGFDINIAKLG